MSKDHHIIGVKTYFNVLLILLALTALTVAAAQIDFGALNAFIAMLIASVKAAFVLLYFMHLKYDDKIYWVIFGSSVFFVALLYLLSKIDLLTRIIQESVL